jgi:hypothetical protein
LLEATERCLHVGVGCEVTALGLGETFQHSREVGRVNFFGLSLVAAEAKHRERNLVLTVGRQPPHRFKGFFEELGHGSKIGWGASEGKRLLQVLELLRLKSTSPRAFRAPSRELLRYFEHRFSVSAVLNSPEDFYQFETFKDHRCTERRPGLFEQLYNV